LRHHRQPARPLAAHTGDVKPCFSGHTGAISAPRDD
jgi:hypothetical protein